ncbi:Hypothetical_protein [Hexamita inflata]|uniref:Hypothetical_protein n=1 Tax=Hexamita inflata TaxID=28002 RepID=A0ABP1HMK3_9EUKA
MWLIQYSKVFNFKFEVTEMHTIFMKLEFAGVSPLLKIQRMIVTSAIHVIKYELYTLLQERCNIMPHIRHQVNLLYVSQNLTSFTVPDNLGLCNLVSSGASIRVWKNRLRIKFSRMFGIGESWVYSYKYADKQIRTSLESISCESASV